MITTVWFMMIVCLMFFFFSSRRRHTRFDCDWSSDVCSSDLITLPGGHFDVRPVVIALEHAGVAVTEHLRVDGTQQQGLHLRIARPDVLQMRSEERRVGKECRSRWSPYH